MAEKERSFGNRAGNVAKAPGRVLHTGGLLISDAVNTTTGFFQDILNCVKSTKDKIIDCFSPDKKRYQKILNIPVAAGIGIVGAVETAVKPVVNGVSNVGKTALNATTNTWKSTFGSVFSAKPVSDFSFNTVKTKKGTVNVNTENRVMNTSKPWTINRGTQSKDKKKKVTKANTQKDEEIDKLKAELQGLKKDNEKETEEKPSSEAETKSEPKPEKKEKKEEAKEKKSEGKEIKETDRFSEMITSDEGKKMINYLHKSHPEIKIETDNSTDSGHLYGTNSGNKIVVGSKKKEEIPQILLHEISHVLEQDDAKGIKELKDYVKSLNEKYDKQLFSVSNNKKYDTNEKKTLEDICELIASYARNDGNFHEHMKELQEGRNEKLAKISDSEEMELKNLCEKIISNLN